LNIAEVIAHVAASTGWTWDYIAENVDLVRLAAMNDYWRGHPPVHAMVAAYFGIKPEEETARESAEQDFSALLSMGAFKEGPLI
jgi:hypothetical protein